MDKLNRKQIEDLLPHRDPMLLVDELYDIKKLTSATAVLNVKKKEEQYLMKQKILVKLFVEIQLIRVNSILKLIKSKQII